MFKLIKKIRKQISHNVAPASSKRIVFNRRDEFETAAESIIAKVPAFQKRKGGNAL